MDLRLAARERGAASAGAAARSVAPLFGQRSGSTGAPETRGSWKQITGLRCSEVGTVRFSLGPFCRLVRYDTGLVWQNEVKVPCMEPK